MPARTPTVNLSRSGFISEEGHSGCKFQNIAIRALKGNVLTQLWFKWTYYSLSHKTMNTRENFWNVYCFATNQMRDETAKDNRNIDESQLDVKQRWLFLLREIFNFTGFKG